MWKTSEGSTSRLVQLCIGYFIFYVITGVTVKYFLGPANKGFPGMSGIDLARQYADDTTVSIILFTGDDETYTYEQAIHEGAADFLLKPLRIGELDLRIRRALEHRRLQIEQEKLVGDLERMAVTDRNVLRLGAFEIVFADTPDRVAINEAVELAKRFGAKQSAQFVNGILDRFLREAREREDEQQD